MKSQKLTNNTAQFEIKLIIQIKFENTHLDKKEFDNKIPNHKNMKMKLWQKREASLKASPIA